MEEQPPEAPPPEPPPPEPERHPFWGYLDLLFFAGLVIPSMLIGWAVVKAGVFLFHIHGALRVAELLCEQFLGYGILFGGLRAMFRLQYGRPFWRSLGWTATRVPIIWCVVCGFMTTLLVGVTGWLIRTPPTSGPLMEMMQDRTSLVLLAIFGTTAAPLFEELAFRGFLQPLLVRNVGAVGGIALASALFGGLHYSEYGDSWRSALLVAVAGAAFGCMRQWTGSTAAAAIMHASFNGLQFMAIFAPGRGGPH